MKKRKQDIIAVEQANGMRREVLLPDGIRSADLINLSNEDIDVLCLLKVEGRKTRYYFEARGQLDAIKRLKTRGLIVAVRRGANYAYDLSSFGYKAFELHLI